MGVSVNWDDRFRPTATNVIRVRYVDPWTWDDFYDAMNQVDSIKANSSDEVNFINDFTQSSTLPPSNLNHLGDLVRTLEEVGGVHIMVQFGALWDSLTSVIQKRYPHMDRRIIGSTSVDDAQHVLMSMA